MEWLALAPAPGVFDRTWLPVVAMATAMVVDRHLGEPPLRWHPVVWMGQALQRCAPWVLPRTPTPPAGGRDLAAGARGAAAWCAIAMLVVLVAWALQHLLMRAAAVSPGATLAAALGTGLLLKPLLAWRMLRAEVQAVEAALAASLEAGRARLAHLASRDARQLQATEVREAAIESLAENLNDSVVAPLFWFLLAGLPGAALYRFANTADAMWGYPGERHGRNWAWAGKWAARADDVLSWLPARLTALLLALAAGRVWLPGLHREAVRTPSPNSGWPMAAMALLLGLRLRKPAVYVLNAAGRTPMATDTGRALALARHALWLAVALLAGAMVLGGAGALQ
jgi:adenosylcobinamide-phosphate synthase